MIKNGTYKKCIICGEEYYVIPSQEARGRYKTCSLKCGITLRNHAGSKKLGKSYPHLQRAEIKLCRTCGDEFRAIGDHNGVQGGTTKRNQYYCSHTCYVKGNRVSKFEDMVHSYLKQFSDNIERQVRFGKWSFDMSIKGTNVLIEADGSYWHSLKQSIERDARKDLWCANNGMEIYHIDELSFYKNKENACQVIIDRMRKLDPSITITKNGKPYG